MTNVHITTCTDSRHSPYPPQCGNAERCLQLLLPCSLTHTVRVGPRPLPWRLAAFLELFADLPLTNRRAKAVNWPVVRQLAPYSSVLLD